MKRNDVGDLIVLYVEPGDQRTDLFQTVGMQKKPVVIIPAGQTGVLQRPDDFTLLKYVNRQADLPIIFILPHGSQQAQLAARNGFPVYTSMDTLQDALSIGQIGPMRMTHSSGPSRSPDTSNMTRRGASSWKGASLWEGTSPQQGASPWEGASPSPTGTPHTTKGLEQALPLQVPDGDNQEVQQRSRRISQQFTPMPESFLQEEDGEQQDPFLDSRRTVSPDAKENVQHNAGNPWFSTHANMADRNTGPLVPRNVGATVLGTGSTLGMGSVQGIGSTPAMGLALGMGSTLDMGWEPDMGSVQGTESTPSMGSTLDTRSALGTGSALGTTPTMWAVGNGFVGERQEAVGGRQGQALPTQGPVWLLRPPIRFPGKGKPRLYSLLSLLMLVAIGTFLVLPRFLNGAASSPQINGHLVFTSSGQVSETSSQGIEDQITLDLTNLATPATGKALYAWLLGDKSANDPQTILLGKLQINNGMAHLFYPGNAQHNNILLTTSRMLVTEEDAAFTPIAPSPDQGTWRYYSEFSSMPINAPDNTKHFSFLDHLRHLLAADPTLDELELPGGLNNWLYNNTSKVKEWVDSTRQQWEETKDTDFVRRQLERTLQFLDGDTFVYQDIPPGVSLLVNERLARVGLINVTGPNQEPPDYLDHISHHLNGLLEAKPTPATQQKIAALTTALGNVDRWLKQVRQDAQQIMKMTDDQMMQQSTLSVINDMIANMDSAYSGQPDPSTNTVHEGVNWVHNQMQFLATLDITPQGRQ